ncbi:MAG TPA: sigma-70 family RNA polymerase sigma factor [Burkholderiales bacterium]|nr:sigma-70 family RNA polymerase sigma factor [Burkholderiales bacterium]
MAIDARFRALDALYADNYGWLRRWLQRKLGCAHQAADLTQDTFLRLLASPQVEDIVEPRAFLTTIAKRVLANHYRRREIERAYLEALALMPEAQASSPEARAIVIETLVEIDLMLDGLPALAKQVFLLAQVDDLPYAAIARELDISISTVKRYLLKAARHCYFGIAELKK